MLGLSKSPFFFCIDRSAYKLNHLQDDVADFTWLLGLHEKVESRTPAGRWGVPQDLSGIAVFLASAASDFVTGTAIPVDGGYSVQG